MFMEGPEPCTYLRTSNVVIMHVAANLCRRVIGDGVVHAGAYGVGGCPNLAYPRRNVCRHAYGTLSQIDELCTCMS